MQEKNHVRLFWMDRFFCCSPLAKTYALRRARNFGNFVQVQSRPAQFNLLPLIFIIFIRHLKKRQQQQ